jgi:uncharacterized membrane protein YdjX (TVP38/TMEM64 family)
MRDFVRPLVIIAVVMLVPIVPFAILGSGFEDSLQTWFRTRVSPAELASAVVLLLASDIVLPVPSSFVSTLAGFRLGIVNATCVSWFGMMTGAIVGFGLARWIGPAVAGRFAATEDMERLQRLSKRYGALTLAITRPIPILAEAAILLLGMSKLSWRTFLWICCLSNAAVALVYSVLGSLSFERGHLAMALVASVVLPLTATVIARRLLPVEDQATLESKT